MFNKAQITSRNVIFSLLLVTTLLISFLNFGERKNIYVHLIFFLIGFVSLTAAFYSRREGYSLTKVFWLFNYTFFFIAPIVQFKNSIVFYTENFIKDKLYVKAGIVIIISSIIYFICYQFFYNKIKNKSLISIKSFDFSLILFLAITSSIFFLYLIKFNLQVLLYRPPSGWLKQHTLYGNLGYAIASIIRYIPFFCLLAYFLSSNKNKKGLVILTILTLLITFPFSLSRGIMAGLYLPLILLYFPIFRKKHYFLMLFFSAILIVFPLTNSFRHISTNKFELSYMLFTSSQFDAFQNFMLLLNEEIVTNGKQLLDGVFFLNGNIKGSGQVLGEKVGYDFYNVAMPYLGEGYINFGYIGIFIFVIILAFFNAFLDKKQHNLSIPFKAIYLVLIGFEFYILRGDLSSSIKKMAGFVFALLIVVISQYIYTKIFNQKAPN